MSPEGVPLRPSARSLITSAPIVYTVLMIGWTVAVSPHTAYGDNWALLPIFGLFLISALWHIGLVVVRRPRWLFFLYGLVHLSLLFPIAIVCLMKISKDSL